jgi:hypothetical protein
MHRFEFAGVVAPHDFPEGKITNGRGMKDRSHSAWASMGREAAGEVGSRAEAFNLLRQTHAAISCLFADEQSYLVA